MLHGVVVNYRTPQDLQGFVHSWVDHAPPYCDLTIVNVDPQDVDRTVGEWAADITGGRLMTHCGNVGYSRACNDASVGLTAPVLAFFNADTRLLSGTIDPLYDELLGHDSWGVIGPLQVDERGCITHAGILGTNDKPRLRGWMQPMGSGTYNDVIEDAVSVMGSAYFVKKKCWDELRDCPIFRDRHPEATGAFLPTRHYYEETWCSYHATAHGWRVVYYGQSKMIHKWHQASPIGGPADRLMGESRVIFRGMCDAHEIARD